MRQLIRTIFLPTLAVVLTVACGENLAGADSFRVEVANLPSTPQGLTVVGERIYFWANDGIHGFEPWVSDGTSDGTVLLKDIQLGQASSNISGDVLEFELLGSQVFFFADDGTHGTEPWVSDGTSDGTVLLKDVNPGFQSSTPSEAISLGGRILFFAADGIHGDEIWVSNGTTEGTIPFREALGQPEAWRASRWPILVGDRYFLSADDGILGDEVWISDGTPEGTTLLMDIQPGPASSNARLSFGYFGSAVLTNRLLFTADDGIHGHELWISDGTPDGTSMLKDIQPGSGSSYPARSVVLGDRIFFEADDGIHGRELWVSDGTPDGTSMLKDIQPGGSYASGSIVLGDRIFFSANDGSHGGVMLWSSDGTPEGTVILKDIAAKLISVHL